MSNFLPVKGCSFYDYSQRYPCFIFCYASSNFVVVSLAEGKCHYRTLITVFLEFVAEVLQTDLCFVFSAWVWFFPPFARGMNF